MHEIVTQLFKAWWGDRNDETTSVVFLCCFTHFDEVSFSFKVVSALCKINGFYKVASPMWCNIMNDLSAFLSTHTTGTIKLCLSAGVEMKQLHINCSGVQWFKPHANTVTKHL